MDLRLRKIKKDIWLLAFFVFILVIIFRPTLSGQKFIYLGDFTGSDLTELNYPLRVETGQSFKAGQVPIWTQELSHGFPFLAEGQAGVFYPINILFTFLPSSLAYNWVIFLNFLLAGWFFYIFVRRLNISRQASLFGAISFSLSGFFVARLKHLNIVNVAIWLPLTFYFIEKYFKTKKIKYLIWLALVGSIQIMAGHLQMAYYCLLLTFTYFMIKFVVDFKEKNGLQFKKLFIRKLTRQLLIMVIVGLVIIMLAAIQLLPSYELIQFNNRIAGISWENAVNYPFSPKNFINFLVPYFWGNPANASYIQNIREMGVFWENAVYIGIFALLIALFAIVFVFRKNKYSKIFVGLLIGSMLLVLGEFTPVYRIFWQYFPGFNFFRFPNRFIIGVVFSLSVLACFGWDKISGLLRKYFNTKYHNPKAVNCIYVILLVMVSIDLVIFTSSYFLITDTENYYAKPHSVQFLEEQQKENEPFRIYSFGTIKSWKYMNAWAGGWKGDFRKISFHREVLQPDYNLLWDVEQIGERAFIEGGVNFPRHVALLQAELNYGTTGYLNPEGVNTAFINGKLTKTMGMENVKYITSFFRLDSPDLERVKKIESSDENMLPLFIYENKQWMPRAWAVDQTKVLTNDTEIINYLLADDFNPTEEVVLEKDVGELSGNQQFVGTSQITKYTDREIVISTDFNSDGYLVLSNTYYPGWQAEIDNQQAEILQANFIFQAVKIPAGQSTVTFSYQPKYYYWGKIISIITFIGLVIFLIWLKIINKFGHGTKRISKTV